MVLAYKRKQQKNRSFIPYNPLKIRFGHSAIISVSSGFLSDKTIKNFYIIIKKIFKNFKSISKFWIYLNTNYIITRKPLNVRMGKGKGSRKGLLSLVRSGNSILELKYCRLGLFLKIYKYISVRCSFNVKFIFSRYKSISRKNIFVQNYNFKMKDVKKIKNRSYISDRMDYVLEYYEKSINMKRYKHLRHFFNKFYKSGFYYKFQKFFYDYFYFFSDLNVYINLNVKHFLFYRKLLSFFKKKDSRLLINEDRLVEIIIQNTDFNFKNVEGLVSIFLKKKKLINSKYNFTLNMITKYLSIKRLKLKNLKIKRLKLKNFNDHLTKSISNFIKSYKKKSRNLILNKKKILKKNYIIKSYFSKIKKKKLIIKPKTVNSFYFYNFIEYDRLME